MIAVAYGERVGQRVVEWYVPAFEVRHRGGRFGGYPLVVPALVERLVAPVPAVVQILDEGQAQITLTSGRNGSTSRVPSDWCRTRFAARLHCRWGSPKPRTPFMAPK